jgi:hypothetical protein
MNERESIMTDWAVTRPQCRVKDITGQRFGRLLTIRFVGVEDNQAAWLFRCDCGTEKIITGGSVKSGGIQSCGCLKNDQRHKHGYYGTPTYYSWQAMKERCTKPNHPAYHRYGGRGISFCERWKEFVPFLEDMGERPDGLSLDRYPNKDGHYEKSNCRWASPSDQMRNTSSNRMITFDGETMALAAWAELYGIKYSTLRERLQRGWPMEDALFLPPSKRRRAANKASQLAKQDFVLD